MSAKNCNFCASLRKWGICVECKQGFPLKSIKLKTLGKWNGVIKGIPQSPTCQKYPRS